MAYAMTVVSRNNVAPNSSEPTSLADFVRRRRTEMGLTQNQLAERSGLSTGWFGRLESGSLVGRPKVDTLTRLANALGVSFERLMELAGYEAPRPEQGNDTRKLLRLHGYKQATDGIPSKDGYYGEPTTLVPVYGPVACGEPFMWSSEEAIGFERLSEEDAKLIDVVLVVAGDSLSAERINDGDRLGVQRLNGEKPPDGAIVVVEAEGSYMAKVYRRNAVGEYLESRRLGRDPEPLLLGDEVRLIGRARKHIRNL